MEKFYYSSTAKLAYESGYWRSRPGFIIAHNARVDIYDDQQNVFQAPHSGIITHQIGVHSHLQLRCLLVQCERDQSQSIFTIMKDRIFIGLNYGFGNIVCEGAICIEA